ncbi:hypothetical protein NLU13_9667 [Sarocladium strictum]|uniref:ADP-ribosylhydrolase ARH3 n=1 Tax=Sarocladium strictum TaxID=5046 RepID=A0AA39GB15_SARSR|nr:hypothetical protein NLU13_9667 [Sarocladium strictum]
MSSFTPRQSRTIGALLGVHAGDSLGATLEFKSHSWILENYPNGLHEIIGGGVFDWPPGHATDDTDMTRAVLLAYQDHHRLKKQQQEQQQQEEEDSRENRTDEKDRKIVYLAADRFLEWFTGDPWPDRSPGSHPLDIGGATHTGLTTYTSTRDPLTSGAGAGSAGNGSLMRCIPTALFVSDPKIRLRDSVLISGITHNDPRCVVACAAYNAMAAALVNGKTPDEAVTAGEEVTRGVIESCSVTPGEENVIAGATSVLSAIALGRSLSLPAIAQNGPPDSMPGKCGGYVLETLTLTVAAVLDTRCFEDVLVDVTRVGKDTDTNGAVAGGLLGAREGFEGIPAAWREKLQFGREFEEIALELLDA